MAKMQQQQHQDDGRKHNATLLSQQIPYPSTGQYPNQQPNKFNMDENRAGSMMQSNNQNQSHGQNLTKEQNQQHQIRSASQNAVYPNSNQNLIQYTDNIITSSNVHNVNQNIKSNQQKSFQNQISDLPYNNLKGEKARENKMNG